MAYQQSGLRKSLKRMQEIYFPLLKERPGLIRKILNGYFNTLVLRKPVLKSIEFSITTKCNSRCKMCFAYNYRDSQKKELNAQEVRNVWLQAKKLGAIGSYLLGGEPTIREDLFEILEALETKKYLVGIVTNSLLLSEEFIKKLKRSGVTFLSFSLDSLNEEANDELRNCPGHYKKVISAIALAKAHKFRTDISCLLSHSTLPKIEEFIDFALRLGVDYIAPSVMVPVGNWANADSEMLTENDWIRINELIKKYHFLKFDFLQNFSLKQACPGGIEKLAIGPYGDVMICNVNPISFGNIREESLDTMWKRVHKFKFFKLGRNYKNCVVAADKEYQNEILKPISAIKQQPVFYLDHPSNINKYFT